MAAKRTRADRQVIVFNGHTYQKYPERRYYEKVGGRKFLHRDVWEFHNGPIPSGYHVHHIDGNPTNNAPENLQAFPSAVHFAEHKGDRVIRGRHPDKLKHLAEI